MLLQEKVVIVSGIGKSGHIGHKMAATLASTGTPASFVHAAEASQGDLGMITRDDLVILISRSGFTAWGVDLARQAGLTLVGRAKGKRFIALSGEERIVHDADPAALPDEERRFQRKGSHEA